MSRAYALRNLTLDDMDDAARVHRISFDERLPWLAGLHTPDEDRAYFRERLFQQCELWGAFAAHDLIGIIAFREGWIDQLYVLPAHHGRGVGSALLTQARATHAELQLWTFQKNLAARRFYETRGFTAIEETDGSANEEREPDVRYVWRRLA
ncbi:GNAT family N-acetyltransferase [Terrarubrum flagellatum]|uniref:GNAT family N-acetyltransferase n=1 Tax=Terrirubrum flagellatum TaxID=2895980 RepID=UPI0031454B04